MQPFISHRGIVATLDRANVDTDQIIPKQFLKSVRRTGFEAGLFYDWRFKSDGAPDPSFVLNQGPCRNATVLVARGNFGCGSSREHAVWAIMQYGIRVLIAPWRTAADGSRVPAFADIFASNAVKNGLLLVQLSETDVDRFFTRAAVDPGYEATIDLASQVITLSGDTATCLAFEISPAVRQHLLAGLDDIALTLAHEAAIADYERRHRPQA